MECPTCLGAGFVYSSEWNGRVACARCDGSGRLPTNDPDMLLVMIQEQQETILVLTKRIEGLEAWQEDLRWQQQTDR